MQKLLIKILLCGILYRLIHVLVWWNGRRVGLKIRCTRVHVGSSPTTSTNPVLRNGIFLLWCRHLLSTTVEYSLRSWRSFALLTRLRADLLDSIVKKNEYYH